MKTRWGSTAWRLALVTAMSMRPVAAHAQAAGPAQGVRPPVPVPALPVRPAAVPEPDSPPARTVQDARTRLLLQLPVGWNLARHDGELSRFRLDARSAPRASELRLVGSLGFNPYPTSTFAGALFYLSVAPAGSAAQCAAETTFPPVKTLPPADVAGVRFARGTDEHGHICTEARDVVYTALRPAGCVRMDLVVNTFCGGEVSGARPISEAELAALFGRMQGILDTVRFLP